MVFACIQLNNITMYLNVVIDNFSTGIIILIDFYRIDK